MRKLIFRIPGEKCVPTSKTSLLQISNVVQKSAERRITSSRHDRKEWKLEIGLGKARRWLMNLVSNTFFISDLCNFPYCFIVSRFLFANCLYFWYFYFSYDRTNCHNIKVFVAEILLIYIVLGNIEFNTVGLVKIYNRPNWLLFSNWRNVDECDFMED